MDDGVVFYLFVGGVLVCLLLWLLLLFFFQKRQRTTTRAVDCFFKERWLYMHYKNIWQCGQSECCFVVCFRIVVVVPVAAAAVVLFGVAFHLN